MGGACCSRGAVQVHPLVEPKATAVVPGEPARTASAPAGAALTGTTDQEPIGSGVVEEVHGGSSGSSGKPSMPAPTSGATGGPPGASAPAPVASAAREAALGTTGAALGGSSAPQAPEVGARANAPPRGPKKSLIKAAKDGDLELIDQLLGERCDLEATGMWDNTSLLAACMYGKSEAALKLIGRGAKVTARNECGATAMHYAAVEGCLAVVEALLSAGATTVRVESARQPEESNSVDVAATNDSEHHISEAVKHGNDAEARSLVNCGLARVYNRHIDAYAERTPLGAAAECGFAEVTTVLLQSGAEVDARSEAERTPLWLACRHSRVAVARLLLQHGADTGAKDSKGVSVLGAATCQGGNCELVLALLSHGVQDVNDTTMSPLRQAVKAGRRPIVEALLTHGASAGLPGTGDSKATPLHAACERGDEYFITLLVRARADPSTSDLAGRTAFDMLRQKGFDDGRIATLLRPPEADSAGELGSTGATGETAMYVE